MGIVLGCCTVINKSGRKQESPVKGGRQGGVGPIPYKEKGCSLAGCGTLAARPHSLGWEEGGGSGSTLA